MVSDAESLGAQDRIPREAIEAACDELDVLWTRDQDPPYTLVESALEAAYPLIREAVCQELAEKLEYRAWAMKKPSDATATRRAAKFVRSFGASPGGE